MIGIVLDLLMFPLSISADKANETMVAILGEIDHRQNLDGIGKSIDEEAVHRVHTIAEENHAPLNRLDCGDDDLDAAFQEFFNTEPTIEKEQAELNTGTDVDPLDAFMNVIYEENRQIEENRVVNEQNHEHPSMDNSSVPHIDEEEDADNQQLPDQAETPSFRSFSLTLPKEKRKELPVINHFAIDYPQFQKNLYIVPKSLSNLTNDEILASRNKGDPIRVSGKGCPAPIDTFDQAGLDSRILDVLHSMSIETPTPIQRQVLPAAMSGRDVMGIAQTGSGKTLAYVLPMIRHVLAQPMCLPGDGPVVLVIAPTRELCVQIYHETKRMTKSLQARPDERVESHVWGVQTKKDKEKKEKNERIRSVCIYGGGNGTISDQIAALKRGAEVVVCTPGRMIEILCANNGKVTTLFRTTLVILDEADRMLDLGFVPQITRILQIIRPDRQTMLFSATFPKQLEAMARSMMTTPIQIQVGKRSAVCSDIEQIVRMIGWNEDKLNVLVDLLKCCLLPEDGGNDTADSWGPNSDKFLVCTQKEKKDKDSKEEKEEKKKAISLLSTLQPKKADGEKKQKVNVIPKQPFDSVAPSPPQKGQILVFVREQSTCDEIYAHLIKNKINCLPLHGGREQTDRDSTIVDFKRKIFPVMVATSVAARGLDVRSLTLVVNYEVPDHLEDYVHRVGRTGRAGSKGTAITFVQPHLGWEKDILETFRKEKAREEKDTESWSLDGPSNTEVEVNMNGYDANFDEMADGGADDRYIPLLVRALDQSGVNTPFPLRVLASQFLSQVGAENLTLPGTGFAGKGYKFDETEEANRAEAKKQQELAFNMSLQDSAATEGMEDQEAKMEILETTGGGGKTLRELAAEAQMAQDNGEQLTDEMVHALSLFENKQGILGILAANTGGGNKQQQSIQDRVESLRRRSQTPSKPLPTLATLGTVTPIKTNSGEPSTTVQVTTKDGITFRVPKNATPERLDMIYRAAMAAEAVKLEKLSNTNNVSADGHCHEEIEVNDFPPPVRVGLTNRAELKMIAETAGVAVTTRGVYCPLNKKGVSVAPYGERKLYIAIDADSNEKMERARALINEKAEELMQGLPLSAFVTSGRYSVVD
ncbi:putative Pre-mRNA-processing ATP-dependent RNA helicase PRP5 [Blattamonas nauphoetae]|uniref:RNA helicase n=1 Tax=Blattamonas nauphoetae TaxID=2049346 RepID=A0ABQ9YLJ6_9EUKA|nr:putative Pre-mRNA-processing ATP-dependent RNA helicase PRP5 [Blattamonas nauphoetae]